MIASSPDLARPIDRSSQATAKVARRAQTRDLLLLCGLVLGAFALRVLPFVDRVLQQQGILPAGDPDVYYHLRRIELATKYWPRVPDFDRWINFPDGGFSAWPPLFDFVPATFARASGLAPSLVAVFWPPLLGALTLLPFVALVRRIYGAAAAVPSALLFALLPANIALSVLGRVDHHVAEVLLQLWIYLVWLDALQALERGEHVHARRAFGLGVLIGIAFLTWTASVLSLWVPAAVTCLWLLPPRSAAQADRAARLLAAAYALGALVCLPYAALSIARGREPFGFFFLSLLQPALCLGLGAGVLGFAWIAAAVRARDRRALGLRLGALAALCAGLLLVPTVRTNLLGGLTFVSRSDSFSSTITESVPLLSLPLTRGFAHQHVGLAHLLLPVFTLLLALSCLRAQNRSAGRLVLLLWAVNATTLAFLQARFLAYAAPLIALLPGAALHALGARRALAWPAAIGCAALCWPALSFYWSPLLDRNPHTDVPLAQTSGGLLAFTTNIRGMTPPAGDPSVPERKPGYCVFAPWELGHELLVLAERPVVPNNYGIHMEGGSYADAQRFYVELTAERDAVELLERRGCRYVVTTAKSVGWAQRWNPKTPFASRLHTANGADHASGPGSGRLRLLSIAPGRDRDGVPEYKLFELVPGAELRITGLDDPGARVETVLHGNGPAFSYSRRLERGPGAGVAHVRLSYPGAYRVLGARGELARVSIEPAAVERGATLAITLH